MRLILLLSFMALCLVPRALAQSTMTSPPPAVSPPLTPVPNASPAKSGNAKKGLTKFVCAAICERSLLEILTPDDKKLLNDCAIALLCGSKQSLPLVYQPRPLDIPGQFRDYLISPEYRS